MTCTKGLWMAKTCFRLIRKKGEDKPFYQDKSFALTINGTLYRQYITFKGIHYPLSIIHVLHYQWGHEVKSQMPLQL